MTRRHRTSRRRIPAPAEKSGFVSGHDLGRAVELASRSGLQPLRPFFEGARPQPCRTDCGMTPALAAEGWIPLPFRTLMQLTEPVRFQIRERRRRRIKCHPPVGAAAVRNYHEARLPIFRNQARRKCIHIDQSTPTNDNSDILSIGAVRVCDLRNTASRLKLRNIPEMRLDQIDIRLLRRPSIFSLG